MFNPNDIQSELAAKRIEICDSCDSKLTQPYIHCVECGCNLDAKTSCLTCECPKQKWLAVVNTIEEEEELKKQTI
jgi:hypothetical protein